MNKQLVMTLLASGALVGLSGCSEGDEATIIIDAPTNIGDTSNSPAPAPCNRSGAPGPPCTLPSLSRRVTADGQTVGW